MLRGEARKWGAQGTSGGRRRPHERREEELGAGRWRDRAQTSPTALTFATAPAPEAASGPRHRDAPPTFAGSPAHPFVALVTSLWPVLPSDYISHKPQ